jgi:NADH-quinone oxidoreductase subunit G
MRVHPRDNESVNETWISDRDRFSYAALNQGDRLTVPLVKRDGVWVETDWAQALELAAQRLRAADPVETGWLLAPNATLEEMYLAQAIARALGCPNVDHRLRQRDFRGDGADPLLPWLGVPIPELDEQDAFLLIGSDIRQEQPILAHRIRKATLNGATVALVNPYQLDLTHASTQLAAGPAQMLEDLAAIAKTLRKRGSGTVKDLIAQCQPTDIHAQVGESLKGAQKGLILLGGLAAAHPDYTLLKALAYVIAEATKSKVGFLSPAANSVGAHLAGALPHLLPGAGLAERSGIPVAEMLAFPRRTWVLWGVEPDLDLGNPGRAMDALGQADFVIAASVFRAPSLESIADLMLPIGAFAETSGTYVNASGTWQSFQGAVAPPGESRPGWKVLRVLGNLLQVPGFDYRDNAQVRSEIATLCAGARLNNTPVGDLKVEPRGLGEGLIRLGSVPIYAVDPLVRRSPALQRTPAMASAFGAYLHPNQASALGLAPGDAVDVQQNDGSKVRTRVVIDSAIPPGCVRIPSGVAGSELMGEQIAPVTLVKSADAV